LVILAATSLTRPANLDVAVLFFAFMVRRGVRPLLRAASLFVVCSLVLVGRATQRDSRMAGGVGTRFPREVCRFFAKARTKPPRRACARNLLSQ
jgi:hypothetical protein